MLKCHIGVWCFPPNTEKCEEKDAFFFLNNQARYVLMTV